MDERKILLVDDDPEDRDIIKYAMELAKADDIIYFAENGEQALEILDKNYDAAEIPCLIVLDLNMPKMNGTQTLGNLKSDARFKDIPVIIYSTSINPLEKEKCMNLGAHSYITKPVSFKESTETAKVFLEFCNQ
jgi:CheY-like chemotaxis protein